MHCHFHNPVSIHSGPGMRRQIGALAAKYGKKALIVTTGSAHSRALAEEAGASLEAAGLGWAHYNGIRPNPLGSMATEGAQAARDNGCDMVIGIGGGSVMDASKGIAFAYYNDAPIFEYIYGRKQGGQALPILLIATTAGTGSEGNWTAVFTDTDHVKKGFALPALYPKESIVDPELMTTLSSRGIAGPGFDALAHAIESFLSVRANPFSKLYSRQAILWLSEGLPKVQANPSDLETWERVALGSTFAGIAIGNAGCTAPHGIEHPISGLLNVAHGEGLAAIYPEYMRFMRPHAQADFAELARLLGAETSGLTEEEASLRAVEQVDALLKTLGIAFTLSDLGVRESQLDWLSRTALDSMPAVFANNPAAMTSDDVKTILNAACKLTRFHNRAALKSLISGPLGYPALHRRLPPARTKKVRGTGRLCLSPPLPVLRKIFPHLYAGIALHGDKNDQKDIDGPVDEGQDLPLLLVAVHDVPGDQPKDGQPDDRPRQFGVQSGNVGAAEQIQRHIKTERPKNP
ncbi:MAG: iron-containing alcohol dehydrogenase [Bilophila wadsworthia]